MTDFLLLAFIFLVAGVISVPIATRLGLGSVIWAGSRTLADEIFFQA